MPPSGRRSCGAAVSIGDKIQRRCERFARGETLNNAGVVNAVFVVYSGSDSGFDSISEEVFYASCLVPMFVRVRDLRTAFNGGACRAQSG